MGCKLRFGVTGGGEAARAGAMGFKDEVWDEW